MRKSLVPGLFLVSVSALDAHAVGWQTRLSCASDYYAYCSQHAVGSAALRKCMRDNGPRLSKSCVNALIADGEISKAEVERTKAQIAAAKSKPQTKPAPAKETSTDPKQSPKAVAKSESAPKAAAPRAADAKIVALPVPKPARAPEPKPGLLDQATYEALKRRVHHFLADPDSEPSLIPHHLPQQPQTAPVRERAQEPAVAAGSVLLVTDQPAEALPLEPSAAAPSGQTADGQSETVELAPADAEGSTPETMNVESDTEAEETGVTAGPRKPKRSAKASSGLTTGKMGLGKTSPPKPVEAAPPPADNSSQWNDYMQRRFEGGLNFQGLGARFGD